MKQKELRLKKIYLKDFISVLIDMYDQGADFIDIIGQPNGRQDTIGIEVKPEYLATEEDEEQEYCPLTRELLNKLM